MQFAGIHPHGCGCGACDSTAVGMVIAGARATNAHNASFITREFVIALFL